MSPCRSPVVKAGRTTRVAPDSGPERDRGQPRGAPRPDRLVCPLRRSQHGNPEMRLQLSTWQEVEAYLGRSKGIIMPVGSTEQHGPNGLIGTDAICPETAANGVAGRRGTLGGPKLRTAEGREGEGGVSRGASRGTRFHEKTNKVRQ